tara:strand:- start:17273 stop:17896 length:624 start_codon:yes stop_codon:yes gene_type:complete
VKYISLLLLSIVLVSCGKNQDKKDVKRAKPLMSLVKAHEATENVLPVYYKEVKDWKELKTIDSFFVKFRKISPNEALSNAIELKDLVKNLKDSIKPKSFDTPSLNARINILNNEVLRLADLTEIGAIQAEEVNKQVDKTMSAFSDLNTKINTILAKVRFENEIKIDVKYIGLDSTKIDSVSKKSIDLRLKEKQIEQNNLDKGANKRQ